ncbi:uncharacterized protein LOC142774334 [Rhipicephalus microplus]|uniref:uncharacterized protein LOC142774334 n=1 Tax=Rhipicephalus microplus TaxID=6941 RepID=UPI003F6CFA38
MDHCGAEHREVTPKGKRLLTVLLLLCPTRSRFISTIGIDVHTGLNLSSNVEKSTDIADMIASREENANEEIPSSATGGAEGVSGVKASVTTRTESRMKKSTVVTVVHSNILTC